MRIIVKDTYDDMGIAAAKLVAKQIYFKPNSVLGLATGETVFKMYEHLVTLHNAIGLDFSETITFALDEYIGLDADNPQSYRYFIQKELLDHLNIREENIFFPNGMAKDMVSEGFRYDALIQLKKGIDLQILGIGKNAHIGFNEPNIKFEATTHKVKLDDETIQANSRFFDDISEVPQYAISMGIKTIMLARKILLLASGENKAEAVYKAVCGGITPTVPASILQLHQDVTMILDKAAAAKLPVKFTKGNV